MKLEKDLNKYNKEELLDLIFSFVEEEAFEEKELKEMLNLSEEELKEVVKELIKIDEEICRMVNDKEDEEECDGHCKCEEEIDKDDVEVMANQLALNEEMIIMAESVVAGLRVLVSGGVDYNNALQLCSNQIQNKQNLELAKYNCVVNQGQNQI